MQLRIQDGVVDLSGEPILKRINIEINTQSKIGIVGRNGCGKTTLLRLLAGELQLSKDDPEMKSIFTVSGKPTIGTLNQIAFKDNSVSLLGFPLTLKLIKPERSLLFIANLSLVSLSIELIVLITRTLTEAHIISSPRLA